LRIWIKVVIISIIIIFGSLTAIILSWPAAMKKVRNTIWLLGPPELGNEGFSSEEFVSGLNLPTKMTFIDDDILVLEKNTGMVRHISSEGILAPQPVLDLDVATINESGLVGIVSKENSVYLYYTAAERDGSTPIGNKVVKYRWTGSELKDPILLKDLPVNPITGFHNGGAMVVANDGTVFATIGDYKNTDRGSILQNIAPGEPDPRDFIDTGDEILDNISDGILEDRGVILPVDPVGPYYAIGIRNSYGLAVDPFTGNMWETENGASTFDEINFVPPKFNGGWKKIMGPSNLTHLSDLPEFDVENLPEYDGFKYRDPEFSWVKTTSPTAIVFPTPERFEKYQDSLFVGDCNNGNIYRFVLDSDRTGFVFQDPSLQDLVFNQGDNNEEILIGQKYGCITDMQFGPDGYLYVVSLTRGAIYKLSPET